MAYSSRDEDAAADISGSGGTWDGCIFTPEAQAKVQGSDNLTFSGCIVAEKIILSGSLMILQQPGGALNEHYVRLTR